MRRSLKLAFLYACKALGLFWLARQVTSRRLRILCYHGFEMVDEAAFREKLFIRGARFARRMETLKRQNFRVLLLDEAVHLLYRGELPRDTVVITVDDGFHSFREVALPHLQRFGYPATVYVTTYHVQHKTPVFNLAVQYLFWKTDETSIDLRDLGLDLEGRFDLRRPQDQEAAAERCVQYGRALDSEARRQDFCHALGMFLGTSYASVVGSRILTLMDEDDFRELARSRIDIQLHTHRHRFPADDKAIVLRELDDNRAALAPLTPGQKRHFCYPSGLWDRRQWPWLDEAGVVSSTTCLAGLNDATTPRHGLRRFLDGENIHQMEFEAALSGFSDFLVAARERLSTWPEALARRGNARRSAG